MKDRRIWKPPNFWVRFSGPILTLALAALMALLVKTPLHVANPPALFMLAIVFSGFSGGLISGLISAGIAWTYTAYFFSQPGQPFQFSEENFRRVMVWAVTMPFTAYLVGLLNRRAARALAEAEISALRQAQLEERARVSEALRQANDDLRAGEARFRTFVDHATDAFFLHDDQGIILDVNRQACASLGYTREELIGMSPFDFDAEVDPAVLEQFAARLDAGEVIAFDTRHRRKDGTLFPVEVRVRPFWEGGRRFGVSLARDITERKQVEEALLESQERLRLAVQASDLGPWDWDLRTNVVDFSPEWKRQLGYEPHEIPGRYEEWEGRLHPDDRGRVLDTLQDYLDGRRPDYTVEFRLRHKDGSYRWIYTRGVALWDALGQPARMLGCHLDVTERKQAERALVESHGLLNAVIEGTADAVFVKDLQGRYLMINSAGARFIGRPVEEIVGKDDRELFTPESARLIRERDVQVMETGGPQLGEETATAAGVRRTYLTTKSPFRDAQGKVVGLIGIARDVTELKRLEEQLRHSQKMEAMGRLAGGVAHDFNNLLTVINGYGEMVFSHLRADDPSRELVAEIQKAGERAANLTGQLLAFSRKQVLQPQIVSLNGLLGESHKLLQRLIGEDVELALVLDPTLGLAKIDPGQFEQAVINLAVNARDAMPQGGRLTIETRNVELDESHAERYPEVGPGRYLLLAVTDTGHGMDEATRARIFEPFFTTKGPGKGTGLGLAMVYGFVKQSGGHVEAYSEVGRGTTFKVYLPADEVTASTAKSSPDSLEIPKGTETLLLVEDEDSVRAFSRLVLQSSGYTVLEARDGQEGVWVAQQHPGPIHLLVTDLVMPRMSGRQLADLLARTRPHLRILFMSGYTGETVMHHGMPEADLAFLQKPFSPLSLARKVREVLDAEEA
ncbi:MAG TPA: PAS domain S-box protein [Thermoanaerobaculia bacterium]|jgi:PAS domain S-box-containing protein|nr:PAS domain S-box protein [Thermoanaerobaculia bacterium]